MKLFNENFDRIVKDGVAIYKGDTDKKKNNGDLTLVQPKEGSRSKKPMIAMQVNEMYSNGVCVQAKTFAVIWNLFLALDKAKNKDEVTKFVESHIVESKPRNVSDQEWSEYLEFKKQKANGTSGK